MSVVSVQVDNEGRLTVPKEVRDELGIQEGDVFYFDSDRMDGMLVFAPAVHPLLQRIAEGEAEYKAGLTKSLDEVAAELGIDLQRD